jgi:hypothetical protein
MAGQFEALSDLGPKLFADLFLLNQQSVGVACRITHVVRS